MISDPVAQCRSALGLSPDGLLQANQVYANFGMKEMWMVKYVY